MQNFKTKYEYIVIQAIWGGVGTGCDIPPTVFFGSEPYLIEIGNHVRITADVKFLTHDGGLWVLRELYSEMRNADFFGKIKIEDNVHIGWNAIIMPGVTIGRNSIVGCGAVVTKDVPANSVVAGVPAKVIETLDQYYCKKMQKDIFQTKTMSYTEKREFLESKFLAK